MITLAHGQAMPDRVPQLRAEVLHHTPLLGPLDGGFRPVQHGRVDVTTRQTGFRGQSMLSGVGHLQAHTGDSSTYIHEMSVFHNFMSQNAINKAYPSR